jgi:hypothetical protein
MLLLRARGDELLRVSVAHVETSLRAANVVDRAYVQHSDRRAAPDVALRPIVDWSDLDFDDGRLNRSIREDGAAPVHRSLPAARYDDGVRRRRTCFAAGRDAPAYGSAMKSVIGHVLAFAVGFACRAFGIPDFDALKWATSMLRVGPPP